MTRRASPAPDLGKRAPLRAWSEDDGPDRLGLIEQEVAALLREVAEAKAAVRTSDTEHEQRTAKLLLSMIEVADGFERVFRNIHDKGDALTGRAKIWVGNFRTVYRLLGSALKEQGVAPIESPTGEFDPAWHTVVETVVDPSHEEGTIVREIRRGYMWRKRVLRRAEVVVAQEEPGPPPNGAREAEGRGGDTSWES